MSKKRSNSTSEDSKGDYPVNIDFCNYIVKTSQTLNCFIFAVLCMNNQMSTSVLYSNDISIRLLSGIAKISLNQHRGIAKISHKYIRNITKIPQRYCREIPKISQDFRKNSIKLLYKYKKKF